MTANEEILRNLGFENTEEFSRLVASVDMSTTSKLWDFQQWQQHDGSKVGLMKLLPLQVIYFVVGSKYSDPEHTIAWYSTRQKAELHAQRAKERTYVLGTSYGFTFNEAVEQKLNEYDPDMDSAYTEYSVVEIPHGRIRE